MNTKHQPQQPKEREIHEIADIYNVVSELWDRAAPELSKDELEWFKQSSETAQVSLRNFAAVLKAIGTNVMCDGKSKAFQCNETVAKMLFVFSDYVRCLEAMVSVGDFADEQLRCGDLLER